MSVTDSGGTKMHVYSYDNIYQFTDVNYPVGYDYLATDTTFNYDATGNRTTVIDDGGKPGTYPILFSTGFAKTTWMKARWVGTDLVFQVRPGVFDRGRGIEPVQRQWPWHRDTIRR